MSKPNSSREFIRRALREPETFWAEQARSIHWQTPFRQACDFSRAPFTKWFLGGTTDLCYNAVDRHVLERGDQVALSFYSTEVDQERSYTYRDLHWEVQTFAGALLALGVERGDRVIIYLPMIPEAVFAMLACVRLGAIHSVVFAGFAPASLATRIDDAEAKVLITADAARPAAVYLVNALPKTRSGKVLRRAILAAAEGRDTGDLSTLEDPIALDAIRQLVEVVGKAGSFGSFRRTGPR